VTVPVRSAESRGDLDGLRARLAEMEALYTERDAEITKARTELAEFRIRYRRDVGGLHEELDRLERAIAEAELGEFAKRLKDEGAEPSRTAGSPRESAPRLTSDAVRKLFRDVARTIHPDLAQDEEARDRRHALMVEANRAYALGDEERLRMILDAWERSPEAVQGDDPESTRARLERRIGQLEERLVICARELTDLQDSRCGS
jgi:hypothetical protein